MSNDEQTPDQANERMSDDEQAPDQADDTSDTEPLPPHLVRY